MPEARPLQPGDPARLGDYEISGRLGDGGLGAVFLGLSPAGGSVAIRVMRLHSLGDEATRSRFLGELQVARRITTSCTAQVIDTGVIAGSPYIVNEYVRGPSLEELVAAEGPRGRRALERLAIGTATALAALHRAGIVHRDLRPANVLLASDGPRLIDVGISRALDAAGVRAVLTAGHSYLAPEQSPVRPGGGNIGPEADVFAWGSTVLFAATGQPPFGHGTGPEVMGRIMHDEPGGLLGLPESVRDIVSDALAKDPAQRPTARELLDRLLGAESPTSGMSERKIAEARTLAADDGRGVGRDAFHGTAPGPMISPIPASNATFVSRPDAPAAPTAGIAPSAGGSGAPISASFAPQQTRPQIPAQYVPPSRRPGSASEDTAPLAPAAAGPYDPAGRADPGDGARTVSLDSLMDSGPASDAGPGPGQGWGSGSGSGSGSGQGADWGSGQGAGAGFDSGAGSGAGFDSGAGSGAGFDSGAGHNATTALAAPAAWQDDTPGRSSARSGPGRHSRLTLRFQPSNRVLGVAGAVAVGVLAGVLLIVLVLRPQAGGPDDGKTRPTSTAAALDNTPVQNIPAAFKGTWRGTAVNQDGKSFQVTAVFREGQTSATVLYTPMNCAGTLAFTRGTRSRLEMTLAAKPCTNGNVIVTKQVDGSLIYAWQRPGTRHQYRATLKAG